MSTRALLVIAACALVSSADAFGVGMRGGAGGKRGGNHAAKCKDNMVDGKPYNDTKLAILSTRFLG